MAQFKMNVRAGFGAKDKHITGCYFNVTC